MHTSLLRLAAAGLAIAALAPPALAQTASRRAAATKTSAPATAAPNTASPLAATPTPAAAPAPALAASPAPSDAGADATGWRVAGLFGFEFGVGDAGYSVPKIQIDAQRPIQALAPGVRLDLVLSLGLLHAQGSESFSMVTPLGIASADVKWGANVFELVPAARVTFRAAPSFLLYGDGGLGLGYTKGTGKIQLNTGTGTMTIEPASTGLCGIVRLAGGAVVPIGRDVRLGAEVPLSLRFGKGVGSSLAILFTASHTL
jgi:hypothetical protein